MDRYSNNRLNFSGGFAQFRRPGPITLAIIAWLVLEIFAFSFVVSKIGMAGALLVGLGTTILGFAALKRLSGDALAHLRRRMETGGNGQANLLDGTLSALGAIFLILPGFITDIIGLALLSPSLRGWIQSAFGGSVAAAPVRRPHVRPDVIDLDESDWRQVEETQRDKQH